MPGLTILDIPQAEQEQLLAHLRAARYGHLLACHILLLCAAGRTPTEIAAALFCSRSSVYRTVRGYRRGELALGPATDAGAPPAPRCRASLKRSLRALLKRAPQAFGWCRTRWSCACLAGALNLVTGKVLSVVGERKNRWLFGDLLRLIERACPATRFTKVYVVVDNYGIHKARAVAQRLAGHPRCELVFWPAYCPRANPIERVFGDLHDKCTRNHKRTEMADLVADV